MNNDLISREALKREIKTECNPYGKPTIDFESGKKVLKIIDNAPTVDLEPRLVPMAKVTFDEDKLKDIVQTEVVDKIKSGELVLEVEERSTDKWGKWVISEIQCPNCSEFFQTDCYSKEELNNCPICHTKLRGDKT